MIKKKLTGIVLAGGLSSRMGRDKGLLPYKGKLMVEYAIDILIKYCDEIIISTNNSEYSQLGYPLVADIYKGKGPLGGIHAGLKASKTMYNIFLSCDMPLINTEAIELLIQQITPNVLGLIPKYGDRIEPMCGIYTKQLVPEIEKSIQNNNLKLRLFIHDQAIDQVDFQILTQKYKNLFSNINFPTDIVE